MGEGRYSIAEVTHTIGRRKATNAPVELVSAKQILGPRDEVLENTLIKLVEYVVCDG